ncbi:uncharacterized protein MELLADRAFT_113881 [Melampsora larici-populina 98AG31]|uniref:Uncharacterized protein n=1 Tax=Melampsora larici-populina (strain 98AG31 / pathotype 3-4-7) TaxID=747676 RepID=F4SBC4_MELLP|nr:uncharacterized protein MELLADRAFT_113881 [Melampsora larici-populina 98AG31]EGF98054.1 hypothetical protein MELLADRAFT_113881 [Melampsora larici-populina 98AG31]
MSQSLIVPNYAFTDQEFAVTLRNEAYLRTTLMQAAFKPILRELVFDIDLTDYDDIRSCCCEARICSKRWKFITIAEKVLDLSNSSFSDQRRSQRLKEELINIQIHYTYPRINLEVHKHMTHILKSPFWVHLGSSTGKVCVPIDPTQIHAFDPKKVPDVRDLLRQLDKVKFNQTGDGPQQSNKPNWEQTSLKPYIEVFEKHINKIVKEKLKSKKL